MSLPEVRFAVDRIISDAGHNNNLLTEDQVKPLLNRADPPLNFGFMRHLFHTPVVRHFYSGSIGDFLDRSEFQEILRLYHLVDLGRLRAEPDACARLKAFKDRGPDSRAESIAVWTVLAAAISGISASTGGGLLAIISKNTMHKMLSRIEPVKKNWLSILGILASAGSVYGAVDD